MKAIKPSEDERAWLIALLEEAREQLLEAFQQIREMCERKDQ